MVSMTWTWTWGRPTGRQRLLPEPHRGHPRAPRSRTFGDGFLRSPPTCFGRDTGTWVNHSLSLATSFLAPRSKLRSSVTTCASVQMSSLPHQDREAAYLVHSCYSSCPTFSDPARNRPARSSCYYTLTAGDAKSASRSVATLDFGERFPSRSTDSLWTARLLSWLPRVAISRLCQCAWRRGDLLFPRA